MYALCRHPIYAGLLVACGGLSLLSASTERLVITLALYALLNAKASEEEQMLAAKHGEYGQWAEEVPRFFPPPRRLLERVGLSKPAE